MSGVLIPFLMPVYPGAFPTFLRYMRSLYSQQVRLPIVLDNASTPLGSETQPSCRSLVVLVNQAAEAVPSLDTGGSRDSTSVGPGAAVPGGRSSKASVRPLVVGVPQVLVEDPLKMPSPADQQPVQAFLSNVRTQRSANALAFGA